MAAEGVRPSILVVDDDDDHTAMYAEFLSSRGYRVTIARDGEDAVTRALNGHFDLIVLDIGLPRLDGIQVLMLLRSYVSTKKVPIVTLSARTGEEMRTAAVDAGADIALEKPCDPEELEETIQVFLKRGARLQKSASRK